MPITFLFLLHHIAGSVQIESLRYFAGAAGVALLCRLLGPSIAHRRIQPRRASRADRLRELRQSLWAMGVFAIVDLLTVVLIALGAIAFNRGAPALGTIAWQTLALVVMHDAYFYWMHRALHHRALFRRFHAVHHLSRTPTSWAAYSFATGEAVFEAAIVPAMVAAISTIAPAEPWAVFIFLGHQIARNAFGHAGFELAWPGFTRSRWTGWLTTTVHHDLHHSEGRSNFGLYFTWWDRWLGTEHPRYHERFEAIVARAPESSVRDVPVHGAVGP
ncbi:sterol desaturase family protein [Novosphingobium huizhouense]|uniref:sterol desaturase family protein n=1 Tax=Novosphingobium huizhouense TaxID=2866625 RepID=UPI001CD9155F|nr:sterol desaturase family protein [Novosphingobium huizhouense]